LRSFRARRHSVVLSAALKFRKERLLISSHEVLDDRTLVIETSLANGSTPSSASKSATRNARSSELRPSVALSLSAPESVPTSTARSARTARILPCTMDSIFAGVGAVSM